MSNLLRYNLRFLENLLEALPRPYLNEIAKQFAHVRDPVPIVRSSLKSKIVAVDSDILRRTLAIWVARQLLPDAKTLDLTNHGD